jgi:hypothetical protein
MKSKIILAIITISLLSVHYNRIVHATVMDKHKEYKLNTFAIFALGGTIKDYHKGNQKAWQGRVVSSAVGNLFCKIGGLKAENGKINLNEFASIIGWYGVFWLALTFFTIIILTKNRLFFILIVFAALQFSWLPCAENLFQPWDGPELFFWMLILLLNTTKHKRHILWLIPVATAFKESSAVLSILILFWCDRPLKKRIETFIIVCVISFVVKLVIDISAGCDIPFFTMPTHYPGQACRTGHYWLADRNLWLLFQINMQYVLFAAAGLPIILFMFPGNMDYKIIGIVYFASIFAFCSLTESRLFNEYIALFVAVVKRSSIKQLTGNV